MALQFLLSFDEILLYGHYMHFFPFELAIISVKKLIFLP